MVRVQVWTAVWGLLGSWLSRNLLFISSGAGLSGTFLLLLLFVSALDWTAGRHLSFVWETMAQLHKHIPHIPAAATRPRPTWIIRLLQRPFRPEPAEPEKTENPGEPQSWPPAEATQAGSHHPLPVGSQPGVCVCVTWKQLWPT